MGKDLCAYALLWIQERVKQDFGYGASGGRYKYLHEGELYINTLSIADMIQAIDYSINIPQDENDYVVVDGHSKPYGVAFTK